MADISQRRSDRVLITLPVSVSGTDAAGKPFSEDATTVTVSQNGAGIALKTALVSGQDIVISRQRTRVPRVADCLVLGKVGEQPGLQVFSVAFQKPAVGFWDIYFPPLPADKDTAGRALLGCKVCGTRRVVHLDSVELAAYNAHRKLSLNCTTCGKSTIWLELQQETTQRPELGPANAARLAPAPPPLVKDQRKHRRVAAEIHVCIRQAGSEDDVATTVDISRGGLLFISRRPYRPGSYIQIAVPYAPQALNVFVDARVVHSSKVPSQELHRVGIMYLAENEP
ncbi:MAG TPA: PilZ domain-containing protein [Terriglobia bacterium]|nr:PilZ domain-containing protein [Terriglobia bacterium]